MGCKERELHCDNFYADMHSYRYRIRQYGHKLDINTEIYRLELILERLEGQLPMHDLRSIPRPSQLDDWKVYEKLEAEKLKRFARSDAYLAWRDQKEHELDRKPLWEHEQEFRPSMSGMRVSPARHGTRNTRKPARERSVTRYFDLGAEHGPS